MLTRPVTTDNRVPDHLQCRTILFHAIVMTQQFTTLQFAIAVLLKHRRVSQMLQHCLIQYWQWQSDSI